MCKTNRFNNLQSALLTKAVELKLPDNIQNSISYAICLGDLWYVIQLAESKDLRQWFLTESQRNNWSE